MNTDECEELCDTKTVNPWNPINREIKSKDISQILTKYGWNGRINNLELFSRACCHKSYTDHPDMYKQQEGVVIIERPDDCLPLRQTNNEELEFLGDRVIGMIVCDYLTRRYIKEGEGFMTRILSRITNNKQLGKISKLIGLGKWIILSRHMEEICNGRNNLRVMGSLFEAWIGALYLQEEDVGRGYKACYTYIINIIEKHIDFVQLITEDTNYKDQLLQLFQALYHIPPRYRELYSQGPPHDRTFMMGVIGPNNEVVAQSSARNKKVAEQEASRIALEILQESPDVLKNE